MPTNTQALHRLARQEYFRQHAKDRRARHKAEGARRIDVTLTGEMLDDYETVWLWLANFNRIGIERDFFDTPKTSPDGRTVKTLPLRLSATNVIRAALRRAAGQIREDE